uniref:Cadherin domain-containing protein n=2 Tax=Amazona TaxID=12929 RepID=A0A8B9G2M9_9PSIT
MGSAGTGWGRRERALLWTVLVSAWDAAWGQLRYSVPEELPKGSFVGDVANDLGLVLPALRDLGVRVVSEGRTQYFALHGKTGHLVTAERIDREQLCESVQQCVLRCEVIVEGEMKFYEIEVEITDVNDNAPSFRQAEKELRMSETTIPGSRHLLPEAHDPDSGPNSLQRYELSGDEHFSLAVQAGPGGDQRPELVLAKALDREEAAFYELVLKASDSGEPARTGTARIRVMVLDANDNAPVFSQAEYTVRVAENVPVGSLLVTLIAADSDEGLNGHVKYIFHKISDRASELFQLDSEKGEISLKDDLDFEKISIHEMQVQAVDGGDLFDTAKVVITVTDVNDNAPEISVRSALTEISEDAPPGTVVALLHVQDKDSGANGQARCSLDEGVPFRLRSSQGSYYSVVTAGELDREKVSEYSLTVRAVDGGSPALESRAVVALQVLDVNDNAPVFAEERYSARLAENNAAGALVLTVRATDADWGQNARVRYRLSEGRVRSAPLSSYVSVQVVTENPLQLFRLEVEILDVNDNSPSFPTSHRTLRIAESATVATRFPLESAQDPDVGTNAVGSYRLSPNSYFSLDVKQQQDGKLFPELVLERALDREEEPELQLVLTAMDGGSPARLGTAQITILVLDVNDNAPTFDRAMYKVQVPENTPVGALLLRLNASDPDEGPNGEIQYSFGVHTSDSVRRLFALDPRSGEVRVSGPLDFEESSFYEIYVRAHDGGVPEMEGHCVLRVEVKDANDNPPEVLVTSLLNPVPEDTPPETVVGLFNVRDRDSGANGDVSLGISSDVPFAIRSLQNHFSLVTLETLDRESTSRYVVELIAQDGGSPALTTTLTLLLNISDVNDNPPHFLQPSYDAFLLENNPPGSLLCTVSASDPDDGDNSRLVYSIQSGQVQGAPTSSFVHINPDNGNLYAQRTFDFELMQVLPVSVAVRDSGSPPLRANVTVYIFVLDQNDHAPTILHPRVPLSAPPGYLVTKVTAVDADAGHNAWLSYHLLPQSTDPSLFHVSLYTGEVRTARAFKDTDMAAQQLIVQVKDNGDPPLSTTVPITVVLEEAALEESYSPRDFLAGVKEKPDLTLYLIIALAAVSTVALATVTLLATRCLRRRGHAAASPCCWHHESPSRDFFKHSSPKLQLNSDGTLKYMEVTLQPTDSPSQCYSTCFSPGSEGSDFTFLRPCPRPATLPREPGAFLPATGTLRERGQVRV